MASDHANHAAAVAAGWVRQTIDRGASASPRYYSFYEKQVVGEPGRSGTPLRAYGVPNDVQATAEASALTALNAQRKHRYSFGAGNSGKGAYGGGMTDDVN